MPYATRPIARVLDFLAFSSLWAAAVAGALVAASGSVLGLGIPTLARCVALGFAGTLCVYNVDRLRDTEHDAASDPDRTRFVHTKRRVLIALAGLGGAAAAALSLTLPLEAAGLCAPVLVLGLFHRRLKSWARPIFKALYVSAAWLAIVVGVPAICLGPDANRGATQATGLGWVLPLMAPPLLANLVATNAHAIASAAGVPRRAVVRSGLAIACSGVALAFIAPAQASALGWIAGAEAAALAGLALRGDRRADERYELVVVDGALFAGALAALVALSLR